jgi:hypothetical protein
VRALGLILVGPFIIFFVVEMPGIVWTCNHTIPAPNAAVLIYNDYTIVALVRGFDGTHLFAGRLLAVIA